MVRLRLICALCLLPFVSISAVQAAAIYESATLVATGETGGSSLSEQLLGSRFSLSDTYHITAIGGHIGVQADSSKTIWGAIVPMAGLVPAWTPSSIESEALVYATFSGYPSQDLLAMVNIELAPGDYALIFGGNGYFGTNGSGFMPSYSTSYNVDTAEGSGSYFYWRDGDGYWATNLWNIRFVVEGELASTVPNPAPLALLVLGLVPIVLLRRLQQFP